MERTSPAVSKLYLRITISKSPFSRLKPTPQPVADTTLPTAVADATSSNPVASAGPLYWRRLIAKSFFWKRKPTLVVQSSPSSQVPKLCVTPPSGTQIPLSKATPLHLGAPNKSCAGSMAAHLKHRSTEYMPVIETDGCPFVSMRTLFYKGQEFSANSDDGREMKVPAQYSQALEKINIRNLAEFCKQKGITAIRVTIVRGAVIVMQGPANELEQAMKIIENALCK